MKKVVIIISSVILLLAVITGCLGMYMLNTPEYALKTMIDDVNTSGMEGLEPHLTGKAKETIDAVSYVTDSNIFNRQLVKSSATANWKRFQRGSSS